MEFVNSVPAVGDFDSEIDVPDGGWEFWSERRADLAA